MYPPICFWLKQVFWVIKKKTAPLLNSKFKTINFTMCTAMTPSLIWFFAGWDVNLLALSRTGSIMIFTMRFALAVWCLITPPPTMIIPEFIACTAIELIPLISVIHNGWQKYFNIALVLQDEWLTIFTRPANTCTCSLKAYAINNIRE